MSNRPPTYTELTHQLNTVMNNLRLFKDYEHAQDNQLDHLDAHAIEQARIDFERSLLRLREMLLAATRSY